MGPRTLRRPDAAISPYPCTVQNCKVGVESKTMSDLAGKAQLLVHLKVAVLGFKEKRFWLRVRGILSYWTILDLYPVISNQ